MLGQLCCIISSIFTNFKGREAGWGTPCDRIFERTWRKLHIHGCSSERLAQDRGSWRDIVGGLREREDLFLLVNQVLSIAVIAVISSLTHKRGERVNPELYWLFRLICMPFKTKEYLTADSTAITAILINYLCSSHFILWIRQQNPLPYNSMSWKVTERKSQFQ